MAEAAQTQLRDEHIGIIGSGLIGRSWAQLFAAGGYNVYLYDIDEHQVRNAIEDIHKQLEINEKNGTLRGSLTASEQAKRISPATSLQQCVHHATLVQECVPENVELKRKIFEELDKHVDSGNTVLSSSSSTLPGSTFTESLLHRSQCLIAHPLNPPLYCPLVEIVPTPWTSPEIVSRTMSIMSEIGQSPVLLKKEVPGFAVNRIQYALLMECWRLVQDGVLSVEDVDKVMTEGLGMRYAFIGPMQTCHLNADGMKDYCERYSEAVYSVSQTFGPLTRMEGDTAEKITSELEQLVPIDEITERRKWRNSCLQGLSALKKDLANSDK